MIANYKYYALIKLFMSLWINLEANNVFLQSMFLENYVQGVVMDLKIKNFGIQRPWNFLISFMQP